MPRRHLPITNRRMRQEGADVPIRERHIRTQTRQPDVNEGRTLARILSAAYPVMRSKDPLFAELKTEVEDLQRELERVEQELEAERNKSLPHRFLSWMRG